MPSSPRQPRWWAITGGTGLLGQSLVVHGLCARRQLVLLVRPDADAATRVESRVDALLAGWEERLQRRLPRPIVLASDLDRPRAGLDVGDCRWFRRAVGAVIHAAASTRFVEREAGDSERANVHGTRRLLNLARRSRISAFHYISTAYAGGVASPDEVHAERLHSVERQFRNPYERSKCLAEHLVKSAPGNFGRTILRPSIIVGDADGSPLPSYPAVFAVLKAAWTLQQRSPWQQAEIEHAIGHFAAESIAASNGGESSSTDPVAGINLVPVGWVADSIWKIAVKPAAIDGIYHLTNSVPVTQRQLAQAIIRAIAEHALSQSPPTSDPHVTQRATAGVIAQEAISEQAPRHASADRLQAFSSMLAAFTEYFRDHPQFDRRELSRFPTIEQCPMLTDDALVATFRMALAHNFLPPPEVPMPSPAFPRDWFAGLAAEPPIVSAGNRLDGAWRVELSGAGGGCWRMAVGVDRVLSFQRPSHAARHELYGSTLAFRSWMAGELSTEDAFASGALVMLRPWNSRAGQPSAEAFAAINNLRAALLTAGLDRPLPSGMSKSQRAGFESTPISVDTRPLSGTEGRRRVPQ